MTRAAPARGALVAALVLLGSAAACGATHGASGPGTTPTTSGSGGVHPTTTSDPPPPGPTSTVPAGSTTTTSPTTPPTTATTTPNKPAPPKNQLAYGDSGPAVLALQKRLISLGYWIGTADGNFGDSTQQAVYAYQKAAGIERDGVVGPETEAALRKGIVPAPRSKSGYVVEVDLAEDLVMIVDNGKLLWTLNTSTGGGYTYCDPGCAVADTPVGVFHIYYAIDRMVTDSLGQLWRPRYFDSGFALHGDGYVPPEPVSHGCVRLSDEAINWVWADNIMPIGTEVWVY